MHFFQKDIFQYLASITMSVPCNTRLIKSRTIGQESPTIIV